MFALPRILYAMASDGLLFSQLAHISERTKTPLVATAVTGLFAGKSYEILTIFFINSTIYIC